MYVVFTHIFVWFFMVKAGSTIPVPSIRSHGPWDEKSTVQVFPAVSVCDGGESQRGKDKQRLVAVLAVMKSVANLLDSFKKDKYLAFWNAGGNDSFLLLVDNLGSLKMIFVNFILRFLQVQHLGSIHGSYLRNFLSIRGFKWPRGELDDPMEHTIIHWKFPRMWMIWMLFSSFPIQHIGFCWSTFWMQKDRCGKSNNNLDEERIIIIDSDSWVSSFLDVAASCWKKQDVFWRCRHQVIPRFANSCSGRYWKSQVTYKREIRETAISREQNDINLKALGGYSPWRMAVEFGT